MYFFHYTSSGLYSIYILIYSNLCPVRVAAIYGRYHDPELQKYLRAGPVSKMKLGGGKRGGLSSSTGVGGGVGDAAPMSSLSKSIGSAVPIFIPTTVTAGDPKSSGTTSGLWGGDGDDHEISEGLDGRMGYEDMHDNRYILSSLISCIPSLCIAAFDIYVVV